MTPTATEQKAGTLTQHDVRWVALVLVTATLNFGSALLFPEFSSGGFSWPALITCLAPALWAGYLLSIYRSFVERVATWAAVAGAIYWAYSGLALLGVPVSRLW
jgi:hypothetical protein